MKATSTLLFITDTHVGAGSTGFQQQPRCPHLLRPVFDALKRIVRAQRVNLVLHGGDLTELGTPEEVQQGISLLKGLEVPSAMCLGNHDLTIPTSYECWSAALRSASIPMADAVITSGDWDVLLLNTHWTIESTPRMLWTHAERGVETLTHAQDIWLDNELSRHPSRPAMVVTHVPPDSLPPRLTGMQQPIHAADFEYVNRLQSTLSRHPRVKLVLAGHNHVNCATQHPGRVHLSTSATLEPPFEVRLIHLSPRSLRVETIPTVPMTPDITWLPQQAWVSGQECDRAIQMEW